MGVLVAVVIVIVILSQLLVFGLSLEFDIISFWPNDF